MRANLKTSVQVAQKQTVGVYLLYVSMVAGIGFLLYAIIFLILNLGSASDTLANDNSYETNYAWRKKIEINTTDLNIEKDLINFNFLLHINDVELKSISNGGNVIFSDASKIVFQHKNNLLNHNIKNYSPETGELSVWITIDTLRKNTKEEIFLYYGYKGDIESSKDSKSAIWDGSYAGVWHLDADFLDASFNSNDGINYGSVDAPGILYTGQSFDGIDNYIKGKQKLVNNYPFTISAWFKTDGKIGSSDMVIFSIADSTVSNKFYGIYLDEHENGKVGIDARNPSAKQAFSKDMYDDGNWHYVAGVFESSDSRKLYVDGNLVASDTRDVAFHTGINSWAIGRWDNSNQDSYFKGSIDEVMIDNTSWDASWVQTVYYLQTEPTDFLTIGAGEPLGGSLPVELIAFEAQAIRDKIELTWKTASETNNDYFTIEKSLDGKIYFPITYLDGAGNSKTIEKYSVIDENPKNGINIYRIKQTDFDGKETVFAPITHDFQQMSDENLIISISPNPFTERFNIEFESNDIGKVDIKIMNPNGQLVYYEEMKADKGLNKVQVENNQNLSKGFYFLTVSLNDNISKAVKVFKI